MRRLRPLLRAGQTRARTGVLVSLVALTAALTLPAFSGSTPQAREEVDVAELVGASFDRRLTDPRSQRPPYLPEPDGPLSTATPPAPMANDVLVSKAARWEGLTLPYLVADTALPFRYHVDRALAERFGLDTVVEAMSQWDGIPGSRWATELASVVNHPGDGPRRDGHPVVYLRHDCPPGYLGVARWNTHVERMHLEHRYGTAALYGTQVDVAVCDKVDTAEQLRSLLAHEVGHVMGMAHLCEPGEVCWDHVDHVPPEEGLADPRCRAMFAMFGPCRGELTERDHQAARHLYPTLPRLSGPTRVETAARASYATTWTHTASTVILARADQGWAEAVVGAGLSGGLDAPLLLGLPEPGGCVGGSAATELARAAENGAIVVLAGEWPADCEAVMARWNLAVRRLGEDRSLPVGPADSRLARLSVQAAALLGEHAPGAGAAFLVTVDEGAGAAAHGLDAAVAAAGAGRRGLPLLMTRPGALASSVERWLSRQDVDELWLVGPAEPGLLADLARLRLTVVRVSGADPIERAAFLAASRAPARDELPVVVAPAGSLPDTVVAASVAGRLGVPLLLSPVDRDPAVLGWLTRYPTRGGYVVGGTRGISHATQRAYSTHVLPAVEPVPSRAQAPRTRIDLPILIPDT